MPELKRLTTLTIIVWLIGMWGCKSDDSAPHVPIIEDQSAAYSGGTTTIFDASSNAFGLPASGLEGDDLSLHLDGDKAFEQEFVTAPAPLNAGLGPIYNAISCVNCHIRDGRGRPFNDDGTLNSMLLRLSLPDKDANGHSLPVPQFGFQLQHKAVFGKQPEAKVRIQTVPRFYTFADGQTIKVEQPTYLIENPYYPLPGNYQVSPRQSRPVFGLGLLEAIDESTLLAFADESDRDGDGISGRANYVWDDRAQRMAIGRFGWKANQPNLLQQTARAYQEDMGITSSYYLQESSFGQSNGTSQTDEPEISDDILKQTAFYLQTLAVPARRNVNDALIKQGEQLFTRLKCDKCHIPRIKTGGNHSVKLLNNQTIFPYTDLLLHDMGEDLADNRPNGLANGSEWRTPPLWGLGLMEVVNRHTFLMHDGRAKTIEEAIIWHGGEAGFSRDQYLKLSATERGQLIAFLKTL